MRRAKLSVVRPAQAPLEPGRKATPEELQKADAEIRELLAAISQKNVPEAAEYLRHHPVSAEAIVWLPTWIIERYWRARQRYVRSGKRNRLTTVLREIIGNRPEYTNDQVERALRDRAGPGLDFDDVDADGTVIWSEGGKEHRTTRKSIHTRLADLRSKSR